MANIKSQIKRNKQNEKRRLRNRAVRSEMSTREKVALAAAGTDGEGLHRQGHTQKRRQVGSSPQ